MKKISLLVLFFFSAYTILNAQLIVSEKAYQEAREHLKNLQEGVLIVNLPTNSKKLKILKDILDRNPNDKRAKNNYVQLQTESKALQVAMTIAYQESYSFSKVYFMPDTMGHALKDGVREGIFVDYQLKLSSDIQLEDNNYYLAYIGTSFSPTSTGKKSLLIEDNKGNLLAAPFPYATPMYSFLDTLTNKSDARVIEKVVPRQQEKLEAFVIWNKKQELRGRSAATSDSND